MHLISWAVGLIYLVGIVVGVSSKKAGGISVPSISIIGGVPTARGEFPFMAALDLDGAFCGGSLIGPSHILTAKHCLSTNQSVFSLYSVIVNTLAWDGSTTGAITRTVKKVIIHPSADIGLLVLKQAVTTVKPVLLLPATLPTTKATTTKKPATTKVPTKITTPFYSCMCAPLSEYADMNAVVTGWGKRGPDEPWTLALLKANVTIFDDSVCFRQYDGGFDVGHELCAYAPGRDTCFGDSGGPIMVNGILVGVTSWGGAVCADPYHAGVYVRIRPFIDWILANMANNPG